LQQRQRAIHDRPAGVIPDDFARFGLRDTALLEVEVHYLENLETDSRFAQRSPGLLNQPERYSALGWSIQVVGVEEDIGVEKLGNLGLRRAPPVMPQTEVLDQIAFKAADNEPASRWWNSTIASEIAALP